MKPAEPDLPETPLPANEADAALIARMATGDESALAALYDRWANRIYSVALQILQAPDRAEDVLEETLWQAWRGAGAYDAARKSVATWLLTVARRKSLERLRARPRTGAVDLELDYSAPDPSFGDASQLAPAAEHAALLEHALRQLPDPERLPVELAYFHGMTQSEIAETLDQPLGAVRTNMRLGVQQLRRAAAPVISVQNTR